MILPAHVRNELVGVVLRAEWNGEGPGPVSSAAYAGQIVDDVTSALDLVVDDALPEWIEEILAARPVDEGPGVYALACLLRDDEATPPALRAIAAAFTRTRISDRPRARSSDPETSSVAAENVVRQRRPGGKVHRILAWYASVADHSWYLSDDTPVRAMTAREIEDKFGVREAHKRTSDLLRDGLLEVALDEDGRDLVRDGGRVLAITRAGREELARMNALRHARPVEEYVDVEILEA